MRLLRVLFTTLAVLSLLGCANLSYYAQAVNGQVEILSKARPIDKVIADPETGPDLKEKLATVLTLRDYASRELGLPDNSSYRAYADVGRPYVLWNVFATPELSLKPREWCFLVTGCVAYRGYFAREDAEAFAAKLRAEGHDVYVGGVTAYSTLGWLRDPMLNTIVHRPTVEIAGLMFHELAHQRLYVRGDTAFSESFAMTIELEGIRRWLRQTADDDAYARYEERLKRREEFVALVLKHRDRLEQLYDSGVTVEEKRAGKTQIFAEMREDYARLKERWGGHAAYDAWFAQDLNNAHLLSLGTYHRHVPALQALLRTHKGDLSAFYAAVTELGQLPEIERTAALGSILTTATLPARLEER